jgi:hypothetical protein
MHAFDRSLSREMHNCIQYCRLSLDRCLYSYCLLLGELGPDAPPMRLLLDTADLSRVAADLILRGSILQSQIGALCAVACEQCAESLSSLPQDAHVQDCIAACRRCARACRQLTTASQAA